LQANTPAQLKGIIMSEFTSWALDAVERAVKTAAQGTLTVLGADKLNILHVDWETALGLGGGAAVLSLLMSIASAPFGTPGTASVVKLDQV
jgi:hypothetical protein